ncbi:hypothetical protein M404DRAFT_208032 [Pisolithus tinctorius Marx 270]|uniref:Uncharacterized protein n=1 Tax=Pisolithus tinctorius Marx 270 TaxID=870435 RepID=A0A0C3K1B2_PISTI|nr:hypothetical protein M404DRAFT_208032 [Pisolithus tinctorius Marx 270]
MRVLRVTSEHARSNHFLDGYLLVLTPYHLHEYGKWSFLRKKKKKKQHQRKDYKNYMEVPRTWRSELTLTVK